MEDVKVHTLKFQDHAIIAHMGARSCLNIVLKDGFCFFLTTVCVLLFIVVNSIIAWPTLNFRTDVVCIEV